MGILNCDSVALRYGTKEILNDITLNINPGSKVGVIGVNGAGKSTLLKLISGDLEPSEGHIRIAKGASLGMLSQHADSQYDHCTVYEAALTPFSNLLSYEAELEELNSAIHEGKTELIEKFASLTESFKSAGGYEFRARAESFVRKLGFSGELMSLPVSSLSGGQKTRLALAVLLLTEHDIYLLDEPTNHLDTDSIEWLEDLIKTSGKTFLIVSHDRYFLDRVTTHTVEIENTRAMMYSGAYTEFKKKKKELLDVRQRHYEQQQREIQRLEEFIENQRRWNRERNIIAAESRMKAIERMDKIERVDAAPKRIRFTLAPSPAAGTDVLTVRRLNKTIGSRKLYENMTFEIRRGDRLFITGPNGSGKSTLMKILTGRLDADSGEYFFGYNQKIGYYDQEQQELDDSLTVAQELWQRRPDMTRTQLRDCLASFHFFGDDVFKQISSLSGGERARLTIAALMLNKSSVLVLDEPTNHLDIGSRETLEEAISSFDGTVICVSHDRYFIDRLATRILEISPRYSPEGYRLFDCSYSEYLERRAKFDAVAVIPDERNESTAGDIYREQRKKRSEQRRKEGETARTEAKINELDAKIAEIDQRLAKPETDYHAVMELCREREQYQNQLDALYERLAELTD